MPNMDGTGPQGKGPKTGRQFGNCEGAKSETEFSCGFGRRCNKPCGRGFGRRFNNAKELKE